MEQRKRFLARFIFDNNGQDLIEYGLLLAIVGISAALIMPGIQTKMSNAFLGWGTAVYNLWIPLPAP